MLSYLQKVLSNFTFPRPVSFAVIVFVTSLGVPGQVPAGDPRTSDRFAEIVNVSSQRCQH